MLTQNETRYFSAFVTVVRRMPCNDSFHNAVTVTNLEIRCGTRGRVNLQVSKVFDGFVSGMNMNFDVKGFKYCMII